MLIAGFGMMSPAGGAVIDIFTQGAQQVERTSLGEPFHSASLPVVLDGGLFRERTLEVSYGLGSGAVDPGTRRASYRFAGPSDSGSGFNDNGYFSLIYRSPDPVDLDAAGVTSLIVRLTGSGFTNPRQLNFAISINDGNWVQMLDSSRASMAFDPDTGIHTLGYDLDRWTRVDTSKVTELSVGGVRISRAVDVDVLSIHAVPEPGVPGLVAISSALLCFRRPSRGPSRGLHPEDRRRTLRG